MSGGEPQRRTVAADVAAVVVHYQNAEDTNRCVGSLLAAVPRPRVLIVVDNSPGDGSLTRVERAVERLGVGAPAPGTERVVSRSGAAGANGSVGATVAFVRCPANVGFGAGVNLGWRAARAIPGIAYLLLVNNDAYVEPDFLPPLRAALDANSRAGAAAGTIRYAAPGEGIWFAGGEYLWAKCRGEHFREASAAVREITFCTACCVLIRMDAMAAVGGMPECYFLYFEDTELSVRLRRAGYVLLYVPGSLAFHRVSGSAGTRRTSPRVAFLAARNQCWFARRNMRLAQRALVLPRVVLDELSRATGAGLRGRWDLASALLRGLAWGLVGSYRRAEPPL